ncbi:membrane protein BRI3-like [Tubulanus polymorphus]|uniref:membrane protein BRI3-like n=1 Tax=Tubulanus polymorphus TaxID=672921 RepID=UPI003DA66CB0
MSDNPPPAYSDVMKSGYPPQTYQPVQQGYQAGPSGYQSVPQPHPSYMGAQQTTVIIPQSSVVVVGGCPACRVGVLEDDFTCLGVCCAILFFPIGILCCLAMRERRCPHCGATFG